MQNAIELTVTSKAVALYEFANTGRTKISLVILVGIVMGRLAFMAFATPPDRSVVPVTAGAVPVITNPTWSAHDQALKDRWDNSGGKTDLSAVLSSSVNAIARNTMLEQDQILERLLAEAHMAEPARIVPLPCEGECLMILQQQMQDLGEQVSRGW